MHFSSDAVKRRSSRLIREKVQEHGAFISRVTDRVAVSNSVGTGPRPRSIRDNVMMMEVNLKAEHEKTQRDSRNVQHHSGTVMVAYCLRRGHGGVIRSRSSIKFGLLRFKIWFNFFSLQLVQSS